MRNYVANSDNSTISEYTIDPTSGALTPMANSPFHLFFPAFPVLESVVPVVAAAADQTLEPKPYLITLLITSIEISASRDSATKSCDYYLPRPWDWKTLRASPKRVIQVRHSYLAEALPEPIPEARE
jgi:hypothetical protein